MHTSQNREKFQRFQGLHGQAQGSHNPYQRFQSEWEKMEKEALKKYRKSLVHKARPMPAYKFFIPKPNLKPLTIPKSPNLAGKRRQILQRYTSADSSYFLLPTPSELSSFETLDISLNTEGGSFLDYSGRVEILQTRENDCVTSNNDTTVDETEEDLQ